MRRNGWTAAVMVAAMVLAGCGSSGGDAKATPLSKAAYVKKGNAICKAASKDLSKKATARGLDTSTSPNLIVKYLTDDFVPSVRGQIDELRNLGIPSGDEARLTKAFDDSEAIVDEIAANPKQYISAADPFAAPNKVLDAYGLTQCGSNS